MDLYSLLRAVRPATKKEIGEDSYLIPCPVPGHGKGDGDRHPSLTVSEGRDGRVLLHCHAGCSVESIVAAFGLTMADVMPAAPSVEASGPRIAATYHYCDEDGRELFEVIRYEPKAFRQRRPLGGGRWSWKLGDVRRVPFRLPELIEGVAAGRTVYIAEGEKDVEALREHGAIATCNPHGAGKWRDEYSAFLRGADVVIVQDRDQPGRAHAAAVAASMAPVAASVRIVQAKSGKDAADHFLFSHGLEDFVPADETDEPGAVEPAPPVQAERPTPDLPDGLVLVPLADIAPQSVDWLWQDRIPRGKLTVIAGDPGLGKSYLTLTVAALISAGGRWPDAGQAPRGHVLIVSAEDDPADTIRPRLDKLGADVSRITLLDGVKTSESEYPRPFSLRLDLDPLRAAILELGAVLVIVDPLNAFLGGIDSHKAAEVRGVLSPLAHLAAATSAAVVAVHHLNKGTSSNALYRASGSLDFVAAARLVHGVAADPDDEGRRIFVPVKSNICSPPAGLGFRVDSTGVVFDREPVTVSAAAAFTSRSVDHEERSALASAKDFLHGELAAGAVPAQQVYQTAELEGLSRATIRRASDELNIVKEKEGGYRGRWLWSLPKVAEAVKVLKDAQDAHVSDVSTLSILDGDTWRPSEDGEVI